MPDQKIHQFLIEPEYPLSQDGTMRRDPTRYIRINDKRIVYFISKSTIDSDMDRLIVPGIVVSEEYRTRKNAPTIDVKVIEDGYLKGEIQDRLGFVGPIKNNQVIFWSKLPF